MDIGKIKAIFDDLTQSTAQTDLTTSFVDHMDLTALNHEIIRRLNKFFSNPTESNKSLAEFSQHVSRLEKIIPQLNGNEQVYYAKLYRVCQLFIENYSKKSSVN